MKRLGNNLTSTSSNDGKVMQINPFVHGIANSKEMNKQTFTAVWMNCSNID